MNMDKTLQEIALVPNSTYNYSNSDVFYSLVNYTYQNYYKTVIKTCQEWLDGYVPSFHKADKGILSSRIGAKITSGIVNQIFGRGLIYVKGSNTESVDGMNFISHDWAKKVNFDNVVKQLIGYTKALGTAMLKLNKSCDGLWVEPIRADYFYFSVDGMGKPTKTTTFVRNFQSTINQEKSFCLVEERYFENEHPKFSKTINGITKNFVDNTKIVKVPYAVYRVFEINATSNNNNLASNSGVGRDYKSLPQFVKDGLRENYSAIRLDEPLRLPFNESLGIYIFKSDGGDITHPSTPFGKPMLFDLISSFMEYDMEVSYSIRDLYNSKGIVGTPKALTQSSMVGNGRVDTPFSQLNIPGYEMVEGLDPTTQKPIITQFEIRALEHETKQNAILKSIATSVGMSPRVIASYLVNGAEKTAEQTHSEDDTITQWVKTNRKDFIDGLNYIIELVLTFEGKVDNVEVRFASDGLVSNERQLDIIQKKMELGLIDIEDAVREINPDLDEEQMKVKIAKAQRLQSLKQEQQQKEFDETFGDTL